MFLSLIPLQFFHSIFSRSLYPFQTPAAPSGDGVVGETFSSP